MGWGVHPHGTAGHTKGTLFTRGLLYFNSTLLFSPEEEGLFSTAPVSTYLSTSKVQLVWLKGGAIVVLFSAILGLWIFWCS